MRINKIKALLLAGLIVFGLMGVSVLIHLADIGEKPKVIMRSVELSRPPPPPPPPPEQTTSPEVEVNPIKLSLGNKAVPILVTAHAKVADIPRDVLPPKPLVSARPDWSLQLDSNLRTFALDDLDEVPRLLSNLNIKFPEKLLAQGIRSVDIELKVIINENGNVVLREILQNPHSILVPVIRSLINQARFSPPKHDGQPVRASFNWPLEISHQ